VRALVRTLESSKANQSHRMIHPILDQLAWIEALVLIDVVWRLGEVGGSVWALSSGMVQSLRSLTRACHDRRKEIRKIAPTAESNYSILFLSARLSTNTTSPGRVTSRFVPKSPG
jgi:hypothetical protein